MKIITKNNRRSRYNFFEIQIGRVVYRCIFCYIQHCAKSKFCAKRSRIKYIEIQLESFLVFSVHSELLCHTNTLLLYILCNTLSVLNY